MNAILETINQIDQSIFFFFNGMHSPFWDDVMYLFTRTEIWLIFYFCIGYFIIKKYRMKAVGILILLAITILISDQFSTFIKETVQRLRPTHDPVIQDLVHNVYRKGGQFGFFSSHATNVFALGMFTSKLFRNSRYSLLIFLWALLVSYTRIYLGVHYPFDILTGIIVGLLIGYFMFKLLLWIEINFFLLKIPKLEDTCLSSRENKILFFALVIIIATVLMAVNQLLKAQIV